MPNHLKRILLGIFAAILFFPTGSALADRDNTCENLIKNYSSPIGCWTGDGIPIILYVESGKLLLDDGGIMEVMSITKVGGEVRMKQTDRAYIFSIEYFTINNNGILELRDTDGNLNVIYNKTNTSFNADLLNSLL